jgi:predicted dehydrogenase
VIEVAFVGAGWIAGTHLAVLSRLGRTTIVGVTSSSIEHAAGTARTFGGVPYGELDRMLDETTPDAVFVCVPPFRAAKICENLIVRGIPFLTEKPLAADTATAPRRVAKAIQAAGLVTAVGYHLRGLDVLPEVRERFAATPPRMLVARWLDATPGPAWWGRRAEGGGQVIEQATHQYDLARYLLGECEVVGAVSARDESASPKGVDVVDSTAAIVRFASGAIGSFANTRRLASAVVELEFASDGLLTTLRLDRTGGPTAWSARFDTGSAGGPQVVPVRRDPYAVQAEAFLDAVEARDPTRVLSSYADALKTDRLTRAVVAATGVPG